MTNKQLQKPDWGGFEPSSYDQNNLIERFRRAETKISDHANQFVISRWRKINEVRRPIILWTLLIVTILGAMAIDLIFGQKRYQTQSLANNSTLVEGAVGKISSLNPLFAQTEADGLVERLIFSRLYEHDSSGALKGDLARSVTISDDELVYTIRLRNDATWHDGEKLTADDVKYTVDLFKNQALNSFVGQTMRGVSVKVLGDYSLEFKLRSAYAPFLSLLDFPILPQHILSRYDQANLRESDFSFQPVGSGKFKFQSFQTINQQNHGQQLLTLIFNEKYYQHSRIERFEMRFYSTTQALANGLKTNEVNAVTSSRSIKQGDFGQTVKTNTLTLNNAVFAFLNLEHDLLKNRELRSVLRSVMNVEELRQVYFAQTGVYSAIDLPILPEFLGPSVVKYAPTVFDVEQKMNELGYHKTDNTWLTSDDKKLQLTVVSIKDSQYQFVAEFVAQKLRQFGIEVELKLIDTNNESLFGAQEIFKQKNYDILVYEINLGTDPDVYGFWHSSQVGSMGLNFSNYSNKTVDDLLATARLRSNKGLRQAKYNNFLRQWLDDVPAVGLLRSNLFYYSLPEVSALDGITNIASVSDRYYTILNWSGNRQDFYKTP